MHYHHRSCKQARFIISTAAKIPLESTACRNTIHKYKQYKADELFGGTNIDELERPWTPKIWVLSEFFGILGCGAHLEWIFAEIYWR